MAASLDLPANWVPIPEAWSAEPPPPAADPYNPDPYFPDPYA